MKLLESAKLFGLTGICPARQRAILLLSDVLDWRAVEIARLLEILVAAVNSALHRARATLEKHYPASQREMAQVGQRNGETNTLLARYLQAWETDDVNGFVALLKEDATFSMPPVPSWYQGKEAIRACTHGCQSTAFLDWCSSQSRAAECFQRLGQT